MLKILNIGFLLVIFALMNSSFAQGNYDAIRITDNEIGFGARALGMGGAYVGVADDYSAVYWNPAGLAQMRKMEFWLGLSNLNFKNDLSYQNEPSNISTSNTKFNSIGFVFPVPTYRGSLVFGFGYQKINDFDYINNFKGISSLIDPEAEDNLTFAFEGFPGEYPFYGYPVEKEEYVTDDGSLNQWNFTGAIDVSPSISVGASLIYYSGSSNYEMDYYQTDVFNNFNVYPANFYDYQKFNTLKTDYSAFSLNLSSLIKINKTARFGLGMELPKSFNVKENWHIESSISFDTTNIGDIEEIIYFPNEDEKSEYDVKMPFNFYSGLSLALGPALISGSAEYKDWKQVKFDTRELDYLNKNFKTEYRETIKYRIGTEIGIPYYNSQIRAGYIYDPTPFKGMPSDNNRKYLTFGFGVLIDRTFKIDFAYLRGTWKQITSDSLTPEGTSEDITYQKMIFNVAYRF